MFRGHFEHAIDEKGRTSLPARFRQALPDPGDTRLVVTPNLFDPCLDVYPMHAWEEVEAKVAGFKRWDRDVQRFRRAYVSAAVECELDKAGRVLVPAQLRERAGLVKEVLWAGVGTTMELWAKERFHAAQALPPEELERWQRAVQEKLEL
ncbi:MAG: division/cell wall cluster transcriptional repressor MraZ [Myxococcales bacterium]|nr:division/cell wall cluster transcriptional repressor MraZ [Myxococcales bacterium]MCC6524657.1 division/cell wall cluster transcriptional repressor MraZ [Polyangiaceae bacterium]